MPKRKTIDDMHKLAESKGFKCLSSIYVNVVTPLKWQCSNGHIWETKPVNIINGNGCPECSGRKRLTLLDMQKLAESRGGKCLSTEFKTNKTPLEWMCSEGHIWEARPDNVKNQGHWCPFCNKGKTGYNVKLTIEEMQQIAEDRGGKCLSSFYINSNSKLKWECQQGHIWEAKPSHIKNSKSWCPICALDTIGDANRLTLKEIQVLAESKGGKCLSEIYVSSSTLMKWQCEHGHVWKAKADSIRAGYWCHVCSGRQRHDIDTVQVFAKSRGGLCLSKIYKNNRTKLKWQCAEGHIWESSFHEVKDGNSWCPHCFKFFSEEKVRFVLEFLFNKPFKKNRKVLGHNLELDGYNEELNLAFEYHGRQHYDFDPFYYKSHKELEKRKCLDIFKEKICQEKGIKLVVVPYNSYTNDQSLTEYIYNCLKEMNVTPEVPINDIPFNLFYRSSSVLDELRELAKRQNGKLISTFYIDDKTKLIWQCSQGHTWEARPNNIKNGSWCPYCSGLMRKTMEDMHKLAESRGGKCLSTEYVNNRTKLLWQCSNGHTWETKPNVIVNGGWCPECRGRKKLTIEDMQKLAEERGGKCLSTKYHTDGTRLQWQCSKGHIWDASSQAIRRGQWCRKCSGHQKLTIEEMREIAKSRGGECLSKIYKDNKTPLRWRCANGHEWEARPNNIKSLGQWCPLCSKTKKINLRKSFD